MLFFRPNSACFAVNLRKPLIERLARELILTGDVILASVKLRQSILGTATDLIRCGTRLYRPSHAGPSATFVNIMGASQVGLGIACLYLLILTSLSLLILSAVALPRLGRTLSDEEFLLSVSAHLHAPLVVCCRDRHFLGKALCSAR